MITLKQYTNEEAQIIPLIQGFWKAHSHYDQSEAEALEDLQNWTKPGHMIYFIQNDAVNVGFAHLGSRGGKMDWLEDLFILPEWQGHGLQRSDSPAGRNREAVFGFPLHRSRRSQ